VQHRLLRQRKEKSENAADWIDTLQSVADRVWNTADSCVRAAVIGHDVRVQVHVVDIDAIHPAIHLPADALRFVWTQKFSIH